MLAVAVASSRTLEVLDLEGTGLSNQSAQVDKSTRNNLVGQQVYVLMVSACPLYAGVLGHGGELPNLPEGSGSGRERHQWGSAAADQRPVV